MTTIPGDHWNQGPGISAAQAALDIAAANTTTNATIAALDVRVAAAEASLGLESDSVGFEVKRVRAVITTNLASLASVSVSQDGLTLVAGNRVLLTGQSTPAQGGIYVVGTVGGGNAPLTRAADMAAASVVPNGQMFAVDTGTAGANTIWKLTNAGTITVATTGLTFETVKTATELASTNSAKGAALIGWSGASATVKAGLDAHAISIAAAAADATSALANAATALAAASAAQIQKRTVTVAFGDLAAGIVNGDPVSVNIGAVLPANARLLATDLRALTPFTGGGCATCLADVGSAGDLNAIIASADVLSAAVDGGPGILVWGVRPTKVFIDAGAQLLIRFTPDIAHKLSDLTAGSMIVDVLFLALP